jgi:hypothetical protein
VPDAGQGQIFATGLLFEPENVQAIIGAKGEYIKGPLVNACCFGYGLPGVSATKEDIEKDMQSQRQFAASIGPNVYYARYYTVP